MEKLFTSPNMATNSDLAFWGDHAFVGYYTGDAGVPAGTGSRGGVRIFDISNPAAPKLVKDIKCDANQNDPIVWDRNGNGIADLLLVAVDRTMASSECGAPRVPAGTTTGWEGVRVFELSDKRSNPFETVEQVAAVYTDCGAHTITLWPGEVGKGKGKGKANLRGGGKNKGKGKLIVYVSSYPLAPGPTCGQVNGPGSAATRSTGSFRSSRCLSPIRRRPGRSPRRRSTTPVTRTTSSNIASVDCAASSPPRARATTSWCTSSTVSPAAPAPSRGRCGGSGRAAFRTPPTRS